MKACKPKRILVLGHSYFVNKLQELGKSFSTESDNNYVFTTFPRGKMRKWISLWHTDLIYLIGGDLRPNRFYHLALRLKKKIIFHWVGTDILDMKAWRNQGNKFSPQLLNNVSHWAEVNWTAAELGELGLSSKVIPLTPAVFPEEVKDLPEKFVVLTYLPSERSEFYGENTIIELARRFPQIVFLVVATAGTERKTGWPDNMIPVGWVDNIADLYREVTLLIRLTQHDGLSFMVLEALANGRHVIWGYPFTGVYQTNGEINRLGRFLEKLYQIYSQGQLRINQTGRDYVARYYNPKTVWERISQGISEVLSQ